MAANKDEQVGDKECEIFNIANFTNSLDVERSAYLAGGDSESFPVGFANVTAFSQTSTWQILPFWISKVYLHSLQLGSRTVPSPAKRQSCSLQVYSIYKLLILKHMR
jgi:hypothetical protein